MNFNYYNPVNIDFGPGALERLPKWIGNRKALLVTSSGFKKRGLVDDICANNPTIANVISQVEPNPTLAQLEDLYSALDFDSFDVIIALGGGSVIDMSKALSIHMEGTRTEAFQHLKKLITEGRQSSGMHYKPIIAIPTTAGTGSEVTPWGTMWDAVNKKKYSIHTDKLWCEAAVCDPKLTLTLPKALTIQTGLDALSHSLESIWNVHASPLSISHACKAVPQIIETLPKLAENLNDLTLRREMMLAALQAGFAFSNTQTAIAHGMSYYMTLHKGIPHGLAASITLPDIVHVALSNDWLKDQLQSCLGENPEARLRGFFQQLDVSLDYKDYNLTQDDFSLIEQSLTQTPRAGNSLIDQQALFKRISVK